MIPVGTAVGVLSTDKDAPDHSLTTVRATFVKFAKVKVTLTILDVPVSSAVAGNAMKPGTYVIFDGLLTQSKFVQVGQSTLNMTATLVHKLVYVATGVPLFSPLMSNGGFMDFQQVITNFSNSTGDQARKLAAADPLDPWYAFTKLAERFSTPEFSNLAQKRLKLSSDDTSRILAASARSAQGITDGHVSYVQFRYSGDYNTKGIIVRTMEGILEATQKGGNLFANAVRACLTLSMTIGYRADKGYVIPFDPLWSRSDMRVIRGGTTFSQDNSRSGLSAGGFDVTGTATLPSVNMGYTDAAVLSPFFNTWLIPKGGTKDDEFILIDVVEYPSWLRFAADCAVNSDTPSAPPGHPMDEVGPMTYAMACLPQGVSVTNAGKLTKSDVESVKEVAGHFAYFNTMLQNLGGNAQVIAMSLRDDIVPGACVGVDIRTPDGDMYTSYGMVASVVSAISAEEMVAQTTLSLQCTRNESEQDIIDKADKPHFAWKRVASDVNKLRLWS